ncbi:PHP domain-containing protein [Kineococcus sp. T13]|nr:PHP domain-containing protein [Kineococcus vitellinus]
MDLPADAHVHSQFSWDARLIGDMEATCARAAALGLPAVIFTEHVDFTPFRAGFLPESYPEVADFVTDGILTAPVLDVDGYLDSIERCCSMFPQLRVVTGMEVGQPHRHVAQVEELLARGGFERVLGSLHCLPDGDEFAEPWELYPHHRAADVVRDYLAEIPRMVAGSHAFTAFAHIDYPIRSWPQDAEPFRLGDFEEELRHALRVLAQAERALEINTRLPMDPVILRWWVQEGGRQVTFGSDAHKPEFVGHGLAEAGALAASMGFAPDVQPVAPWRLSR